MIKLKTSGDKSFKKTNSYFQKILQPLKLSTLDHYGKEGVSALQAVTPKDSGLTAKSWEYKIERQKERVSISFYNTNSQNGVNIAIILQYGHGTRNGGWVEGRDYINPAVQPVFDKIVEDAWKEVTNA
jgi:hypothetical protein|nr:MAG TPA: type I neck protein [Caudoviricetes sp.]